MYTESSLHKSKGKAHTYLFVPIIVGVLALFPVRLFADQIDIYGVSLDVEVIKEVTPSQVLVTVGAIDQIVDKKDINLFVVGRYFSQRDLFRKVPRSSLEMLVRRALENGDSKLASLVLKGLFQFGESMDSESEGFFDEISSIPGTPEAFKMSIQSIGPSTASPRVIAILLLTIGEIDFEWLQLNAARLVVAYSSDIRGVLRQRFFESIREQRIDRARSVVANMSRFFGADDAEPQRLDVLITKLQSVSQGEYPETLAELTSGNPELRKELGPLYLETILSRANELLNSGQAETALRTISQIDFDKRTPETHRLIEKALGSLDPKSRILLDNQRVVEFTSLIAQKDSNVSEAYFETLRVQALSAASMGDQEAISKIFFSITRVFPDPNERNDRLRISLAKELFARDRSADAERLLFKVQTGISFVDKPSILLYRVKENPTGVFLFIFASAGLIFFLLYLRKAIRSPKHKEKKGSFAELEENSEEDTAPRSPFVTMRGRPTGLSAEYVEKLAVFGLTADAELKEIKTAYRSKVKDIHPDHKVSSDPDTTDKFLEIKAVYERLLEIRRAMGLE